MSTAEEKLDKLRTLVVSDPVLFRRRVMEILDEDKLSFPIDREIQVIIETLDPNNRRWQRFRVNKAYVTQSAVRGKSSLVIEGLVSHVEKRADGS